jgi:hypothetical protein
MKQMLLLVVALAVGFPCMGQVIMDEWDPLDDTIVGATLLAPPDETAQSHGLHMLSETDTEDWFQVHLFSGIVYEFTTNGDADTVGDLYYPDGSTRVSSDDDGGDNYNFLIRFVPAHDGIYYLRVSLFEEELDGIYTLTYRSGAEPPPPGDEWDPTDDIREGGTRLNSPTVAEQTHGPHTLSPTDRFDWFQITITEAALYEFWSSGDADTYAELFDADGSEPLTFDNNGEAGNNFLISFEPTTPGKYFLRVQLYQGSEAVYTLHFRQVRSAPTPIRDRWDPADDNHADATPLGIPTLAEQTSGVHTLSISDTDDWYRFTLLPGDPYQFRTSGNSDTYGVLYGPDGLMPVASNDDDGAGYNFMIRFTPDYGGVYYLLVSTNPAGNNASYTLHYQVDSIASPTGDRWDPMDDRANGATVLANPKETEQSHGPHSLSSIDPSDWFKIALIKGVSYEIQTLRNSDTYGELYQADGVTLVAHDDDSGTGFNFRIRYTAPAGGVYLLRVRESSGGDADYTLHWRGEGVPEEEWTPIRVFPLDSESEFTVIPGGFIDALIGRYQIGAIPTDENDLSDGQGVTITVAPGAVELLLFPAIEVENSVVLVRAAVQSTASGAAIGLAALNGAMDNSIATNIPANSELFLNEYQRMMVVYDPPGTTVIPAFQVANLAGNQSVTVYLDNMEVFLLPEEGSVPNFLFYSTPTSSTMNWEEPESLQKFPLQDASEFTRLAGGFIEASAGSVTVGLIPPGTDAASDQTGAVVAAAPGEVELLLFPELHVGEHVVLIRALVQTTGADAEVGLAALDGSWDGSIAVNIDANSETYRDGYRWMIIVYDPPGSSIRPAFQLANIAGNEPASAYLDQVEIYRLPKEGILPSALIHGH